MSLARQIFREFRPLFRMLEEPLGRPQVFTGTGFPNHSLLRDPFFHEPFPASLRPAVDVVEEGNNYVVEAELPGVKKENVQVRVGDGGRSVTIEGRIVDRRAANTNAQPEVQSSSVDADTQTRTAAEGSQAVTTTNPTESKEISSERSFVGTSSFTRTVWLPRRVDSSNVTAKLNDGVLTVTIPKAEDPGSVDIPVQ